MSDKLAVLVYVQLGSYPAKTLDLFAEHAKTFNSSFFQVLITDGIYQSSFAFDKRIAYTDISEAGLKLLNVKPFYKSLTKSYWLNTFERLFALRLLSEVPEIRDLPIIHVESDVLPFITSKTLAFLQMNFSKLSVPRHDNERGIGSILYAPNCQELINGLSDLETLMRVESKVISNDMELLGLGLNHGLIQELPSHPSQYGSQGFKTSDGKRFLFDGAAIGQYLFGQDPFHQGNYRVSGYKNPGYRTKTKVENFTFAITEEDRVETLMLSYEERDYVITNLHIHSKELLPELSSTNTRWNRAIDEANGTSPRLSEFVDEISPHAQIPGLLTRIQIARNNGIFKALIFFLLRKLKK